ncbi:MAG: prolyl-tRNA synthetase associated domain-containing protein [Eubacteriaceae bacterium]|nr:prolyl-tRNA synthetase associated domain-containing protein [Eubacteriaceae bacterium]
MDQYEKVKNQLDELGIEFDKVEHEPALTTEDADRFIEGKAGVRTKSMFLTDKKKRSWFLVIMDDVKRLDMKAFGELVETKGIKMASEESLMEKMMLPAGTVSVFGLINNAKHDIQVYFDEEIMSEEILTFHPNRNDITLFVKTPDVLKFLDNLGYEAHIVQL